MNWSYNGPDSSDKDLVRFLMGDTEETKPLLMDEEIQYLLDTYQDIDIVCYEACEAIRAKYIKNIDSTLGTDYSPTMIVDRYAALAERFLEKIALRAEPYSPTIGSEARFHYKEEK